LIITLKNGALKKETNPYGSYSYTIDSWFKRLTAKDDWLNKTTSFAYTKNAEKTIVTTTTDALDGSASEEIFDDLGRKIRSGSKGINGTFSYVSYLYDIFDRNYKVSEPYFDTTPLQWNETKFDMYSQPVQSILFNSRTVSTAYSGLTTTTTDGSKVKKFTADAAGNITTTNETLGGDITYKYFANGNLKQTTYNGISIDIEQDGWGRKTQLKDPSAGTFTYAYNDYGELTKETSQNGNVVTTITRDTNGKPTKKTIKGGGTDSETNYTYSGILPLTIVYIDNNEPAGTNKTTTTITYDTFKRVESIVEDKENVTKFTRSFTYDALGRVATETKTALVAGSNKSSSVTTKNVYKNGDLYQIQDALNKVLWQTNTLNANGQIVENVIGNGIKMTNIYNNDDGYLSKIQHDKTTAPTANILTLTTAFDKNTDNLDSRINSSFANYTESFKYDAISRLQKFTNLQGVEETQTYDASGKITGNNLGAYSYDPIKKYQNTAITLNSEATGYYANREGIFNDAMENKTGWGTEKYPNTNFFSYDGTKAGHAVGKNTLKLANTTTTEQFVFSDKWIDISNAAPTQYTYSAWFYSDNPQAELFLYMKDGANTVTQVNTVNNTKGAWTQITGTFLVPANVKKLRLRLDNNGLGNIWYDDVEIRKTSDPASTVRSLIVTYNAFKSPSLIEETNVDKLSFTYNDDNQRSTMYYGGFTDKLLRPLRKHYSADGSMEVKQNIVTNTYEFITYIGGDGYTAPIAVKSDGTTQNYLYLHRDYQGTILAVTNATGALVEKRLFDAWGTIIKVQDGTGNTLNGLSVLDRGYTGHEHLQSVGLINMNARLYDPLLHRFLQADNYIQDPTNTQNYNQYGYVLNNPLLNTDPTGNICDCGGGGGMPGVDGGGGTGISTDLKQFGKDTGLDKWINKNFNFKNWSLRKIFGGGGNNKNHDPAPQPNRSSYINLNQANNFAQGFTKMAIQSSIDSYSMMVPGIDKLYDFFGGSKVVDLAPTQNQNGGYYTAMALSFLSPAGAESKVESLAFKGLQKGGKYVVYHGIDLATNTVKYVGITRRDALVRFTEHLNSGTSRALLDYYVIDGATGLSRIEARVWEQYLIKYHKLENSGGQLINKINSIAERYWILYDL
jgi:RHS repeat-associated protein